MADPDPKDLLSIAEPLDAVLQSNITQEQSATSIGGSFPAYINPPIISPEALGATRTLIVNYLGLNKLVTLVKIDSTNIEVSSDAAPSLYALLLAAEDKNIGDVQSTTSFRDRAFQQRLYDRYQAYLNGGPFAPRAAEPGRSAHEIGQAIDFSVRGLSSGPKMDQFSDLARGYGWVRTIPAEEPWHFEFKGTVAQTGLAISEITTSIQQVINSSLAAPQKNLVHVALKNVYDRTQQTNRSIAVMNSSRADYFDAQSIQLESSSQTIAQSTSQQRTAVASVSQEEIPSPSNGDAFLYDYTTGLWLDGKSGGIPGTVSSGGA